jgi:hypothetical protein
MTNRPTQKEVSAVDVAQFVSDYVQMLKDCGERIPPKIKLAKEIADALLDHDVTATPAEIAWYL